jgi:hypothetical protein
MKGDDLLDSSGTAWRPTGRRGWLLAAGSGIILLLLGCCLIPTSRHHGIPIECFEKDVGLTEDQFLAKHGQPDQMNKSGDQTFWLYGGNSLGGWHSGADVVVFGKDHRVDHIFVD